MIYTINLAIYSVVKQTNKTSMLGGWSFETIRSAVCWGNVYEHFSFCDRERVLIYILKNQLFALKYTLKHSVIKIISTPTCFGHIRPSSGSCHA